LMPPNSEDGRPQVSHLVMLGTPNMGSPCADIMNSAFEVLGKNVEAVRQLRQDAASEFNKTTRNRKSVRFSALAGEALPTICYANEWNDGVVTVPSAIWEVKDNAKSKNLHTDLTGTSDFSSFVKPRLAIGPKGNHTPDVQVPTGMADVYGKGADRFYGTGISPSFELSSPQTQPVWAKELSLTPGQAIEIEVPVSAAASFGLVFMGGSGISATIFDEKGLEVGKNLAGTPEANSWFRSIFVNRPVSAGTWKIRAVNTGDRELSAIFTTAPAGPR